MIKKLAFFFFAATLLFSCKTKKIVQDTAKSATDLSKAVETVQLNTIKAHIQYLASDEMRGRDTPSPELNIAARYLATTMMRYGVKKPMGMSDYLQRVPMTTVVPPNNGALKYADVNLSLPDNFLMMKGDNMDINGDMVFINRGTEDDFNNANVKDKIVVALCGYEGDDNPQSWFFAGKQKRELAKARGAKGLLEIYNNSQIPYKFLVRFFNRTTTTVDDVEDDAPFPHVWVDGSNTDAVKKLKEGKNLKGSLSVSGMEKTPVETYNVVGVVEGSDPKLKDEYVIYSAHYDHVGIGRPVEGDSIYNGSRDNAVGSVTVLSAAENIAKYPTKRSAIFIFFTGEEKGLLGSGYYADNPVIPLDKVIYCFNSDNAGYNDTSRVSIIGLTRTHAQPMIEKACATFGLQAMEDSAPEQGLFDRSDNVNFATKGVPAPTFSLGFTAFDDAINKYYHQPQDNPETLDYDYLFKFFKSYVYACRMIGNTSESVFWKEGDKYYDAGKKLYQGTKP